MASIEKFHDQHFYDSYNYNTPKYDGHICEYRYYGTSPRRKIIFVNGMANKKEDHQVACVDLMYATGCEVVGIYNQSGFKGPVGPGNKKPTSGMIYRRVAFRAAVKSLVGPFSIVLDKFDDEIDDLGQCARDDVRLVGRGLGLYSGDSSNECENSLFNYLVHQGTTWPSKPICIVAHSQGNLITSNALMRYTAFMSSKNTKDPELQKIIKKGHAHIQVFAVASPAPTWGTNEYIKATPYFHSGDIVQLLSMGRNDRGVQNGHGAVLGQSMEHAFSTHLLNKRLVRDICKTMQSKPIYPVLHETS